MKFLVSNVVIFLLGLFLGAGKIEACMVKVPLSDQLKKKADYIFEGEAISYSPSKGDTNDRLPAQIKFKVTKMLKGKKLKDISLYWVNGTFGESSSLRAFRKTYGQRTKVGVVTPKLIEKQCKSQHVIDPRNEQIAEKLTCQGELTARPVQDRPEQPWVLQGFCSEPFLIKLK